MFKTHRLASASRSMPPASTFWHPVPQSCTTAFWYRTDSGINIFVYSGTALTGCRTVWHSGILKRGLPCTSILLAVESHTPCTLHLHTSGCGTGHTLHVHTGVGGKGDTLHVQTAGCGNEYTLHVHSAGCGNGYTVQNYYSGCGNGYTLHVHRQLLCVIRAIWYWKIICKCRNAEETLVRYRHFFRNSAASVRHRHQGSVRYRVSLISPALASYVRTWDYGDYRATVTTTGTGWRASEYSSLPSAVFAPSHRYIQSHIYS